MLITTYTCDRCGREVAAAARSIISTVWPDQHVKTMDLCAGCRAAFDRFLAEKP